MSFYAIQNDGEIEAPEGWVYVIDFKLGQCRRQWTSVTQWKVQADIFIQ